MAASPREEYNFNGTQKTCRRRRRKQKEKGKEQCRREEEKRRGNKKRTERKGMVKERAEGGQGSKKRI